MRKRKPFWMPRIYQRALEILTWSMPRRYGTAVVREWVYDRRRKRW